MENLFKGVFDSATFGDNGVWSFLLCTLLAIGCGTVFALFSGIKNKKSKSRFIALSLLPFAVSVVIMMVNGNVGAGLAVAGAFGLVRFRSAQGTARDMTEVFCAMAMGMIFGMGYVFYGIVFCVMACLFFASFSFLADFSEKRGPKTVTLSVTVPEDLNFEGVFDGIVERYSDGFTLTRVKSINFGSAFRLDYDMKLKKDASYKKLLDEIRVLNGNLEVSVRRKESVHEDF